MEYFHRISPRILALFFLSLSLILILILVIIDVVILMLITLKRDANNKEIPRASVNIANKKELVVSHTEKEVNKLPDWSNKFCY